MTGYVCMNAYMFGYVFGYVRMNAYVFGYARDQPWRLGRPLRPF